MIGLSLFLIFVALVCSMLSALRSLWKSADPPIFEDTDFGATLATRRQLKDARLLRRRLNV
jgi:hypothetical protein